MVNRHDEHDHKRWHDKCSMHDNPFQESRSKVQVGAMIVKHPVQTNTEEFSRAPKLLVEDFLEKIMHFKTNLMMLKQRVWTIRNIVLQENRKIEELIGVCAESMTKLSSVEERLKSLTRQQEEYSWEFQNNPLQEYIDKACSTTNLPLYIGDNKVEFYKWIMLGDRVEQHELSIRQHQHGSLIPCVGIHALYPSHDMDWREIMSWNSIDGILLSVGTIDGILLSKGILQLGPLSTSNDGGL